MNYLIILTYTNDENDANELSISIYMKNDAIIPTLSEMNKSYRFTVQENYTATFGLLKRKQN